MSIDLPQRSIDDTNEKGTRLLLFNYAAILAAIVSFLVSFLNANGSRILQAPTLCIIATTFISLAILFHLFLWMKLPWVFHSLLFLIAADLALGICGKFYGFLHVVRFPGPVLILCYICFLGAFCIVLYPLRSRLSVLVCLVWCVFLCTTLLILPFQKGRLYRTVEKPTSRANNGLPNILFVVLDEHIGLAGLPGDQAESIEIKRELQKQYQDKGFLIFENAFSNYAWTRLSLSSVLNRKILVNAEPKEEPEITTNKLFQKLFNEGYGIHVYESTYLDFCSSKDFVCEKQFSYSHNSPAYFDDLSISNFGKAWLVANLFINSQRSKLLKLFQRKYFKNSSKIQNAPLASKRVIDELKKDLTKHRKGYFFFVHLLVPHHSYIYQSNCCVANWSSWQNAIIASGVTDVDRQRREKLHLYYEQMKCTHKLLADLLTALSREANYNEMTILISGDHGSRITTKDWDDYARLSSQDFVNLFSTLMLLKRGMYNDEVKFNPSKMVSISNLVGDYFRLPPSNSKEDYEQVYIPAKEGYAKFRMKDFE